MDWMLIAASVAKDHPISLARLNCQWINIRPGLVIDRPGIEFRALLRTVVTKSQRECCIWLRSFTAVGELRVVPLYWRGVFPHRSASLPCVLNDDAKTHLARLFQRRPENPDTRRIHLDNCIHTLSDRQREHLDRLGIRNGVAIHCDDFEAVTRQSENSIFSSTRIQQAHQYALSLLHSY